MTSEESKGTARLGFVGDLMLGRKVSARLAGGFAAEDVWGNVRPYMLATDAVIGNLEGPITTHEQRWPHWKAFYFRADPVALGALTAGNVRCLALANNHMLDFGLAGMADTRRNLDHVGIHYAGAGANRAEADSPAIFSASGLTVGFASITDTKRSFAATEDRGGTCYWTIRGDRPAMTHLARLAYELRSRGADLLVLSVHWGPNYRPRPPGRYRAFARRAIEVGFHVIHGHSAHILQAAEFHGNGVILYDTGDFVDDYIADRWAPPLMGGDRSGLFVVKARAGQVDQVRMLPVKLRLGETWLADGDEGGAIRAAMIRRCRGYAIALAEDGIELIGSPAAGRP